METHTIQKYIILAPNNCSLLTASTSRTAKLQRQTAGFPLQLAERRLPVSIRRLFTEQKATLSLSISAERVFRLGEKSSNVD